MLGISERIKQAEQAKRQKAPEKTAEFGSEGQDLTSAKDWARIHRTMLGNDPTVARVGAYADRYLKTDEELPLHRHLLLLTIVCSIGAFLVWASFAQIEQLTRGDGRVIPSSEIQIIQHQEGGIIDAFMVKEGDRVQIGQILMRLRDVGAAADLGASRVKYNSLQARIARLSAEAESKPEPSFSEEMIKTAPESVQEELNAFRANQLSLNSELSVLRSQLNQRQQEVTEIQTKLTDLNRVLGLTQDEMSMIQPLVARGSAPKRDLMQLERQMAEQTTELNGLRTALPRARSAIAEAQARINDLTTQFRSKAQAELVQAQSEAQTIGQTLGALSDRRDRTDIRSPVDGIIKDLKINTVGGVVRPGDEVVEIVPSDDQLLVEARVRPSDIAFIYPGQKAMVKLTAYDFGIYGGLAGEVVDISADTITNEKGESFYRVRVRTKESTLKHNGQVLPIIPGMVATVDILTGERTIMEYILKPFIKTMDSAMRER